MHGNHIVSSDAFKEQLSYWNLPKQLRFNKNSRKLQDKMLERKDQVRNYEIEILEMHIS